MNTEAAAVHTFSVYGISCSQCLKKLKGLNQTVPGVDDVVVDMSRQLLKVETHKNFDAENFITATKDLGFEAREITLDDEQEAAAQKTKNSLLSKVGIAGALTGNIMLLSYAVYLGAPAEFYRVFTLLCGALYLPVVLYSATPFYTSSWSALKNAKPSIDLPLALAIILGSIFSYINLFQGNENIYFDSLGALVFLILGSRYIVQRFQAKYLAPVSLKDIFPTAKNEINVGDQLEIHKFDIIPADGIVTSDLAEVDNSLITGEAEAVSLNKGSHIFAGTRCLSDGLSMEVTQNQKNSRISQILEKLNIALNKDASIIELTDSAANYFTFGLFGIGLLFFTIYSFVDLNEAINRVLSLFVIACPCALAMTVPIVLRLSAKQAMAKNYLVKQTDVFEKLTNCQAVVFDKTGTLTFSSSDVLSWWPKRPNQEESNVIFSLEKNSRHPVAKAITNSLSSESNKSIALQNYREISGYGVEAEINDVKYRIGKIEHEHGDVGFYKNDELQFVLRTYAGIRPEVASEVKALQHLGFETYLLTGDSPKKAQQLANEVSIPSENVFANISPEEKSQFVEGLSYEKKVIYVGDGMNDSLAMANAHVAVSMQQSVEASFSASAIHILKDGVSHLSEIYLLAQKTIGITKKLLRLSFAYNTIFGVLALSGMITPLIAAILMPLSSISLLGFGIYHVKGEDL